MKKANKVLTILVFAISLFFLTEKVSANVCNYGYYKDSNDIKWTPANASTLQNKIWVSNQFTISTVNGRIEYSNTLDEFELKQDSKGNYFYNEYDDGLVEGLFEYTAKSYSYNLASLNLYYQDIDSSCPDIIVDCVVSEDDFDFNGFEWGHYYTWEHYMYLDSFGPKALDDGDSTTKWWEASVTKVKCEYYAEENVKDTTVLGAECFTYDKKLQSIQEAATTYGCESDEFADLAQELTNTCDTYNSKQNYAVEGFALACSVKCGNLQTDINKICEGLVFDPENAVDYTCGSLGTKMVSWLFRILKIIRYIVPVLVILLGIIDFMKAIASGNDDEMKKAGAKFVKRLIAATLIFLVPFLLEFIFNIINVPGLNADNAFCQK